MARDCGNLGNQIWVYLVPAQFVSTTVVAVDGNPPDPNQCECEARAVDYGHEGNSATRSGGLGVAALTSSDRRKRV